MAEILEPDPLEGQLVVLGQHLLIPDSPILFRRREKMRVLPVCGRPRRNRADNRKPEDVHETAAVFRLPSCFYRHAGPDCDSAGPGVLPAPAHRSDAGYHLSQRSAITTSYANAAPEEMEEIITRPIEGAMAAVPGVEEISSTSSEGSSSIQHDICLGNELWMRPLMRSATGWTESSPYCRRKWNGPGSASSIPPAFPYSFWEHLPIWIPSRPAGLSTMQIKYRIERVPGVASLDIYGGLAAGDPCQAGSQ